MRAGMKHSRLAFFRLSPLSYRVAIPAGRVIPYISPAQITAGPMNPVERYVRENRELAALTRYWAMTALGISATDF